MHLTSKFHPLARILKKLSVRPQRRPDPMPTAPSIHWFDNKHDYHRFLVPGMDRRRALETELSGKESVSGRCAYCHTDAVFKVSAGVYFGDIVNLREGLVCAKCGLSNRMRLLYKAVEDLGSTLGDLASLFVYAAERISPFYQRLSERVCSVTGSEYIDPSMKSGDTRVIAGIEVTHQDLTATSFENDTFDIVAHADVLEHVADYRQVLIETFRILKPGGVNLFTVPFRHHRHDHLVKASRSQSGEIIHHTAPEIHGNPLDPEGALVFQLYGWKLLDELRESGFESAEIGVLPEVAWGFTSSNSPYEDYIEPVVFLATKGSA